MTMTKDLGNGHKIIYTSGGAYYNAYDNNIVFINGDSKVFLDKKLWNYAPAVERHRTTFLVETTEDTQAKIDNGEYVLANLN